MLQINVYFIFIYFIVRPFIVVGTSSCSCVHSLKMRPRGDNDALMDDKKEGLLLLSLGQDGYNTFTKGQQAESMSIDVLEAEVEEPVLEDSKSDGDAQPNGMERALDKVGQAFNVFYAKHFGFLERHSELIRKVLLLACIGCFVGIISFLVIKVVACNYINISTPTPTPRLIY